MKQELSTNALEFAQQLKLVAAGLEDDAKAIVREATEQAATALRAAYPAGGTGNLRAGVRTRYEASGHGLTGVVESTSGHAHLWEFGTQDRRTRAGWFRGRAPQHRQIGLIPIAAHARRDIEKQIAALLEAAGFEVRAA